MLHKTQKTKVGVFLFLIVFLFCNSSVLSSQKKIDYTELISIINLIVNPKKFHNKKIKLVGFFYTKSGNAAVFMSATDFNNAVLKNALKIELGDQEIELFKKHNRKYVVIEGFFLKNNPKFLNLYSGSITQIKKIYEWSYK